MLSNQALEEKILKCQKTMDEAKKTDDAIASSSIEHIDETLPSRIQKTLKKIQEKYVSAKSDKQKEQAMSTFQIYKDKVAYQTKKILVNARFDMHRYESMKEWNQQEDDVKEEQKINLTFYKANVSSYWLTLSVILVTLVYLVEMLSMMERTFWIGIFILINIAFLLFLFTAAIKLKNYIKLFSYLIFAFGIYTILRIGVIVPFIMNVSLLPTADDANFMAKIVIILVNIYSCIVSFYIGISSLRKVKKQEQYIKEGKITFHQLSK